MNLEQPSLVDTHCHLTLKQFDEDRTQVIERALANGVHQMVVPGVDLESSKKAVECAEQYPSIYAAVGVHPHYADSWSPTISDELKRLTKSKKVVAIGEIGLDFYRNYSPRDKQIYAFQTQLEIAAELKLPVIVHNRESISEVLDKLIPWSSIIDRTKHNRAGVLHAYSGTRQDAKLAIEAGFYLGIAGPISFQNAGDFQRVASELPIERLLIETDSPYLAPHPMRGTRNEPANVSFIVEQLSRIIGLDLETTSRYTTENAAVLFGWKNGTN
jgi:TatD DNase family protein